MKCMVMALGMVMTMHAASVLGATLSVDSGYESAGWVAWICQAETVESPHRWLASGPIADIGRSAVWQRRRFAGGHVGLEVLVEREDVMMAFQWRAVSGERATLQRAAIRWLPGTAAPAEMATWVEELAGRFRKSTHVLIAADAPLPRTHPLGIGWQRGSQLFRIEKSPAAAILPALPCEGQPADERRVATRQATSRRAAATAEHAP